MDSCAPFLNLRVEWAGLVHSMSITLLRNGIHCLFKHSFIPSFVEIVLCKTRDTRIATVSERSGFRAYRRHQYTARSSPSKDSQPTCDTGRTKSSIYLPKRGGPHPRPVLFPKPQGPLGFCAHQSTNPLRPGPTAGYD